MDETTRDEPELLEKRRRLVRRIGWGIVAAGGVLAFGAALLGGSATRGSDREWVDAALVMRNIAAGIMLLGLVTVLISQRLEAIQLWYQLRIDTGPESIGPDATGPTQGRVVAQAVCGVVAFILVWVALGAVLPPGLRGALMVMAALAVPALTGLLILQLRGVARAFFVGVLLVALANLTVTGLAIATMPGNWSSVVAQRELGRVLFPFVTLAWVMALGTGLFFAAIAATVRSPRNKHQTNA
ncbi:MAG: hypothetical protein KJ000_32005 [Pirellulaceae bacterium]|nr:hypothetical protein [Pirellulaceae bacterium]